MGKLGKILGMLAAVWLLLPMRAFGADLSGAEAVVASREIPEEAMLYDGDMEAAQQIAEDAEIVLSRPEGIGSIYLVFDREYDGIILTDGDDTRVEVPVGGILHKYVDVQSLFGEPLETLTVGFPQAAQLNELRVFGPGQVPDWVQQWQILPDGQADLMLFSTHGDDEQLFFAGLLPWYAGEQGYQVQVVYFTDHRNMVSNRVHEMLNGLWAVGVRNYPVFGAFADYYTFDLQDAYRFYEDAGQSEAVLLSFVVEQLRRWQPSVAVGHDLRGEYGHGMHQLYADLLCKAVEVSGEVNAFPELTREYGVWDVPKTYLHLYEENPIVMDWDIPLTAFAGQTAYQVSRDLGFASHESQQKDFAWYFRGSDRAADITKYSPCRYGLYRTTVGEDEQKKDLFENLEKKEPMQSIPEETEQTVPLAEPAQPHQRPEPETKTEKNWPVLPAVGSIALAVMTAWWNRWIGKNFF